MLKVVTLEIVCKDYEADDIKSEFYQSHLAQQGIYVFGAKTRDLTEEELSLVSKEIPSDIFEDAMEE